MPRPSLQSEAKRTLSWIDERRSPDQQTLLPQHGRELARLVSRVVTEGVKLWPIDETTFAKKLDRPNWEPLRDLLMAFGSSEQTAKADLDICHQTLRSGATHAEYLIRLRPSMPSAIEPMRMALARLTQHHPDRAGNRTRRRGRTVSDKTKQLHAWFMKNREAMQNTSAHGFWDDLLNKIPREYRPTSKGALARAYRRFVESRSSDHSQT